MGCEEKSGAISETEQDKKSQPKLQIQWMVRSSCLGCLWPGIFAFCCVALRKSYNGKWLCFSERSEWEKLFHSLLMELLFFAFGVLSNQHQYFHLPKCNANLELEHEIANENPIQIQKCLLARQQRKVNNKNLETPAWFFYSIFQQ